MTSVFAVLFVLCTVVVPSNGQELEWCYNEPTCNSTVWASKPIGFCNQSNQSPINIVTASVTQNQNLTNFTFSGYSNRNKLMSIINNGHTVQVNLMNGVQVSGGGLSTTYSATQFHLHWGNGSSVPGSEHTVDSMRYAMEMHVVHLKNGYNMTQALNDPEGVAVLGFLIEAADMNATTTDSWMMLTSLLPNVSKAGQTKSLSLSLSMDDLLSGVDRSKYYRYKGSLTTPNCNEVVVWTVFNETLKVSRNLINLFPTSLYFGNTTSMPMTNIYRSAQQLNGRIVQSSQALSSAPLLLSPLLSTFSLALMLALFFQG
ncbi:carbonic anhydrase 4 [Amia ocellicauda]|uniref:carbonic anhydrase 4 n=1 Tax=Amia ocellicauda TaxID=2972642 RepID=UPI0034640171